MLDMAMGRDTYSMQVAKGSGRKFFHSRCMSWSYWNREYDARIHRNSMVRQRVLMVKLIVYNSGVSGLWNAPRNMIVVRAFIIMMFIYSAMKNKANGLAAYSTLNPDTSSDSPSVR
jgi:hypothetical protein